MKELKITYRTYASWKELPADDQALVRASYNAADKAYAPFSNFHVGAVLLMDDGSLISGNNQENPAFPSGLCAERTALFYAGANFPDQKIKKIVITAKGDFADKDSVFSPCGGCRQVMVESERRQNAAIEVVLVNLNESVVTLDAACDLMPFTFTVAK